MPRFSVIIPAYNLETYLPDCLESVFQQTFHDYEILVVDDGSTDHTAEVCEKLLPNHPNLRLVRKENGGVSSARNEGLQHVTGEYVWFIDGDDFIHPNALLRLDEFFRANPEVDYLSFRYRFLKNTYREADLGELPPFQTTIYSSENEKAFQTMLRRAPFAACCLCIRRACIGDLRFEPLCTSEDALFALQLTYQLQRTASCNATPYCYYQRPGSFTHSKYERRKFNDYMKYIQGVIALKGRRNGWGDGILAFHNNRVQFPFLYRRLHANPDRAEREEEWQEFLQAVEQHVAAFPTHATWYGKLLASTHSRLVAWIAYGLRYSFRKKMLRSPILHRLFLLFRHGRHTP